MVEMKLAEDVGKGRKNFKLGDKELLKEFKNAFLFDCFSELTIDNFYDVSKKVVRYMQINL